MGWRIDARPARRSGQKNGRQKNGISIFLSAIFLSVGFLSMDEENRYAMLTGRWYLISISQVKKNFTT
jgi:hypothetical protein